MFVIQPKSSKPHPLSLSLPSLQKLYIVISEVPYLLTYRPVPTYVYVYLPSHLPDLPDLLHVHT